jgi:hypothetical protein
MSRSGTLHVLRLSEAAKVEAFVKGLRADCYSVHHEQDSCSFVLKRRKSATEYLSAGRIRVSIAPGVVRAVDDGVRAALGW